LLVVTVDGSALKPVTRMPLGAAMPWREMWMNLLSELGLQYDTAAMEAVKADAVQVYVADMTWGRRTWLFRKLMSVTAHCPCLIITFYTWTHHPRNSVCNERQHVQIKDDLSWGRRRRKNRASPPRGPARCPGRPGCRRVATASAAAAAAATATRSCAHESCVTWSIVRYARSIVSSPCRARSRTRAALTSGVLRRYTIPAGVHALVCVNHDMYVCHSASDSRPARAPVRSR
jgi:hypothetical protein